MNSLLNTPLCDLFGIEYPLLQAPMGGVVTPALVAAVSQAGGLGILAGVNQRPEELRAQIRRVRELTDRPFGVNLLLPEELLPPVDTSLIPDETVAAVQTTLNRFRIRLGLPVTSDRPATAPDLIPGALDVILDERPSLFSIGLGKPTPEMVDRCHARGIKVIAMAATVADAREIAAAGVDAVVAQGSEAGGHRSTWSKRPTPEHAAIGTMALVPQVVDAVRLPVIAAGGIMDGRGLMAALMLGAAGVLMGTRFIPTAESGAPEFHKQALIESDGDATRLTDAFTGRYARVLRNRFTEEYAASGSPVLPGSVQPMATRDITTTAAARGDREYYPLYAGQGVGLIRDVPPAAEVVRAVIAEAGGLLARLEGHAQASS